MKQFFISLIRQSQQDIRCWWQNTRKRFWIGLSLIGLPVIAYVIWYFSLPESERRLMLSVLGLFVIVAIFVLLGAIQHRVPSRSSLFRQYIYGHNDSSCNFSRNISTIERNCQESINLMPLNSSNNQPNATRVRLISELELFTEIATTAPRILQKYLAKPCSKENYDKMKAEYKFETTEPQDNEKIKILDERVRTWAIAIFLDNILKLPQLGVDTSVRARFARAVIGGNTSPKIFNSNTYKYYNTLLDNVADLENLTKRQATERVIQINQLIELFKDIRLHNSAIEETIQVAENQKYEIEKYFAQ